jgi:hypothetical protein
VGIPVVMMTLGGIVLWLGIASFRRNAASGLHRVRPADHDPQDPAPTHDD